MRHKLECATTPLARGVSTRSHLMSSQLRFLCRVNLALATPGETHVKTRKQKPRTEHLKVQFRHFLIELFRQ